MKLGERIRMARKRRKLSGPKLAERLGISPQAISQWETGKTGPERQIIPALTKELRITEDWLFHGQEPLPSLGPDDLEIFLEQLIEVAKGIPEAQRGPAMLVLKALVPSEPKQPKPRQKAS